MTTGIRLGVLEGSLRRESLSRAVASNVAALAPTALEVETLPNPGTLPLFNQDILDEATPESVTTLIEALRSCDAVLIVTPEYNWSIPGGLKNAIDWVSRMHPNPLAGKPVSIWSVSPGLLGGARVHESLRQVLHSQDMRIMAKPEVQVTKAKSRVNAVDAEITDADTRVFLAAHLNTFASYCGVPDAA